MTDAPHQVGLSSADAARRLAQYGPNEAAPVRRFSAVVQLLHLFANPLVVILLVASAISAALGQRTDAVIIITIVLVGIGINFWQTYRSQKAADRLRASVAPTATVLRDGAWQEIPLRASFRATSFVCRQAIWCRRTRGSSSRATSRSSRRC